ncbi:hypothetical protein C0J52_21948 [Blattella germanica]|nr:hypothetical protein C0J52_21948 [Blattella germanica]
MVRICLNAAVVNGWLLFRNVDCELHYWSPCEGNYTLSILATPIVPQPGSVVLHNSKRSDTTEKITGQQRIHHSTGVLIAIKL